jgi:tRNA dimethylallyltransferase
MMQAGLESEVRALVKQYGWEAEALTQTIGYEEFRPYLDDQCSIDEVVQQIQLHTRRLAKRQRTWFRRNQDIHWISKTEQAVDLLATLLNK